MRRRTFLALWAAVALVVGLGAGTAFAYFTSTGSGSGTASTGTAQTITVIQASGTPSPALFPGQSGQLLVQVDNPNSYGVTITGISQNGPVVVVGGSGCTSDTGTEPDLTLGNSGVTVPTETGLSIPLASGASVSVPVTNGVAMSNGSNSGCQGATFQIPVAITVQKP